MPNVSVTATSRAQRRILCAVIIVGFAAAAGLAGAAPVRHDTPRPQKVNWRPATTSAVAAPRRLHVASASESSITLDWSAPRTSTAIASYAIFRNGIQVGTTTYTRFKVGSLVCGTSYQLAVEARDRYGNASPQASIVAATQPCSDTQKPTTPGTPVRTSFAATSLGFAWAASTDNVGVVAYRLYRDGVSAGSTAQTSFMLTALECAKTYMIGVEAVDGSGNVSARATASLMTGACPDTTAPSTPTGLASKALSATDALVSWSASTDNVGVAGYDIYVDGQRETWTSSLSYTLQALECGRSYTVGVDAYDAAGNRSAQASVTFTTAACPTGPADTSAPSVPDNQRFTDKTASSVTMAWDASTDNVGVTGYNTYLDGVKVGTTTGTSYTYTSLKCGTTYTVGLEAFDAAGNTSDKQYASGPVTTLACTTGGDTEPPSAPTNVAATGTTATSISLSWSASTDNVGVTQYGVYASPLAAAVTTTSYTVGNLQCGTSYTLSVDAVDAAGNRSAKTSVVTATSPCPDTSAPTVPTGLAQTSANETSLTVGWNASTDNVGVAGYGAYVGGVRVGTTASSSYTLTGLQCGKTYTVGVDSYDAAGNRSAQASLVAQTSACPQTADTSPPSVPANQRFTDRQATTVTMAWDPSTDNVGVSGYNAYLNGTKAGTTTATSYQYRNLQCGTTYSVALEAFDAAGNVSDRALATGTVSTLACAGGGDTQAPSVPTNLRVTGATGNGVSLAWSASTDNVGVTGYGAYQGSTLAGTATTPSYTVGGLQCGTAYTFAVDATDAAGNRSATATVSGSTAACSASPSPSGSTLYLSPSGSDSNPCTQAAPCKSFDRAYDAAASGAVVEVGGGSYPDQTLSGSKSAPAVVFRPAGGASVSVGSVTMQADNVELRDLAVSDWNSQAESDGFVARNLDVSFFHIYGSSNTSVIGGDVGPSYTPGGNSIVNYITYGANGTVAPTNVLIDGVYFHDFRRGSTADHMECIMVVGGNGVTIKNNRFVRCDIFDIFFTKWAGPEPAKNVLLENNFFNRTTTDGSPGGTSLSVQFSGHMGTMENFTVRNNAFAMPVGIDTSPVNVRFVGNVMPWSGCVSGVTYTHNVMQDQYTNRCSSTDKLVTGTRYEVDKLGFVDPGGGDLHIRADSPAIDAADPSNYAGKDIDGRARPVGSGPDAGAHERS